MFLNLILVLGVSVTWLSNNLPDGLFSLSNEFTLFINDRSGNGNKNNNIIENDNRGVVT